MREYVGRAREAGVQVMAGSGGHLPADKNRSFHAVYEGTAPDPHHLLRSPGDRHLVRSKIHVSAAMGQIIAPSRAPTKSSP